MALSRGNTVSYVYTILMVLAAVLFFYHGYKAFVRYRAGSSAVWINLIHMLLVAPLLAFIGYNGKDTPRYAYELLALTAFSAMGYHIYHMIISMNVIMDADKK